MKCLSVDGLNEVLVGELKVTSIEVKIDNAHLTYLLFCTQLVKPLKINNKQI